MIYAKTTLDGISCIFIGQEINREPDGFVKVLHENGAIYEGLVSQNSKSGWGRYVEPKVCQIGWWKEGRLHGNSKLINWEE